MKPIFFLAIFFATLSAFSQSDKNVENQFSVNILWPGISYELAVGKNTAVKLDAATSLGVISFNDSGLELYPRFDAQFRQYYNFDRRKNLGKRVSGNSGNFYGINSYYTLDSPLLGSGFEPDIANILVFGPASFETFYIGATYGMQRTYNSGFNWGLQFGLGVISVDYSDSSGGVTVTDEFSIYPNFRVTLGWVLTKRKN